VFISLTRRKPLASTKGHPYTLGSFERQTTHLQKELSYLGVEVSYDETARISFLGRRKYDRYDHFFPGETFDSRLLKWLGNNFDNEDRQDAIEVIKALKFISTYEMKQLAIRTFENSRYCILRDSIVASRNNWYDYIETRNLKMEDELSKSIFVASADDMNFDFFRRYAMRNHLFKKENFVEYYKRDSASLKELPPHNRIFLLDQLSASGDTALRKQDGVWKGKIPRFHQIWRDYFENSKIYYCPYILSSTSENNLAERLPKYLQETSGANVTISPTCKIPISSCLANEQGTGIDESKAVAKICSKYYSRFQEDEHTVVGGSVRYGYGGAGLTLVLQSNCPNDSLYLLWHENDWYPLFPRVVHHTPRR
jgi:hypothetical protein